jgi:hypothetical protein
MKKYFGKFTIGNRVNQWTERFRVTGLITSLLHQAGLIFQHCAIISEQRVLAVIVRQKVESRRVRRDERRGEEP